MLKIIHLFRHGQTDWNLHQRVQGHSDIPLNDFGRKQARELQTYFSQNPVDLVASSDLCRALETAKIAHAKRPLPILTDSGLREVYLGEIEGLHLPEIIERFGQERWDKWHSLDPQDFNFCFPRGESALKSSERFQSALHRLCREQTFQVAAVCTHGFVLRRFLHSLRPDLTQTLQVPNCSVFKLSWDPEKDLFHFEI